MVLFVYYNILYLYRQVLYINVLGDYKEVKLFDKSPKFDSDCLPSKLWVKCVLCTTKQVNKLYKNLQM